MNCNIIELDISESDVKTIEDKFKLSDIVYFTGGNSFFLIDHIKRKRIDEILKNFLLEDKLYIGESGGAIICAKDLSYIEKMDEIPKNYSQKNKLGLGLIDFFVLPHYKCEPFVEVADEISKSFKHLDLYKINNSQAIIVENEEIKIVKVD